MLSAMKALKFEIEELKGQYQPDPQKANEMIKKLISRMEEVIIDNVRLMNEIKARKNG